MVVASANKYGIDPNLALAIAQHESGFNPAATNVNTNGTTDWGVMQLNDTTVKTLGVSNPLDPQQNIDAGVGLLAKYLQQYNGDTTKALWAYASGPGAVSSGNPMNPVASQFVGYVQGYDSSAVLAAAGFDPSSIPVYSTPSGDTSSGDWTTATVTLAGVEVSTPILAGSVLAGLALVWIWTR